MNAGPLALADGRRLWVRPVAPQDAPAEQAFVRALSPASRYRRFHVGLRELPASTLAQMTQVDQRAHVAFVAESEGTIVADLRYVRRGDGTAEFALAVADDWQRQGIGYRLLSRLARHAACHGVRTLVGEVLADNAPMIRLLQSRGAHFALREDEPGLLEAALPLRAASLPACAT